MRLIVFAIGLCSSVAMAQDYRWPAERQFAFVPPPPQFVAPDVRIAPQLPNFALRELEQRPMVRPHLQTPAQREYTQRIEAQFPGIAATPPMPGTFITKR